MALASRGKAASLLEDEDLFTPRPGRISLTTLHKAKGLEWDLVYIVGVDGDWFPYDLNNHFRGEYEFLGGDPGEEARAELLRLIGEWEPGRLSYAYGPCRSNCRAHAATLCGDHERAGICRLVESTYPATRMRSVDQAVCMMCFRE